jgi:hypothetical protein
MEKRDYCHKLKYYSNMVTSMKLEMTAMVLSDDGAIIDKVSGNSCRSGEVLMVLL